MSEQATWMTADGKPGQIIACLAAAIADADAVGATTSGSGKEQMTYKAAEDIKRVARKVFVKHGIISLWESSEQHCPAKALGEMRVTTTLIAPDGTYVQHSLFAAAYAGMGRHYTVAVTAAVKLILGLALQLVTEGDDLGPLPAEVPEMSAPLRSLVAAIDHCKSLEELKLTHDHEAWDVVTIEEREHAKVIGERQFALINKMALRGARK